MSQARLLEEAEAEFLKEVQYYADVQAGGAGRFRAAIEEATARVGGRGRSAPARSGSPFPVESAWLMVSCLPYAKGVYSGGMFTFIESSAFERVCPVYLDDDEYAELQQFLMQNPEAGRVVPGSGGVRKLRWA